jgi:drug/metabolite transporter (DMT)-like permease
MIPDRLKGAPTLVVSSFLFAAMSALARGVSGQVSTGQLSFIRFFTGLVVVVGYYAVTRKGPNFSRPRVLAARGFFGGISVIAFFLAIDHLPVGAATLLNNTSPCYAALFAALFLGERLTLQVVAGLLAATVGAGIVAVSTVPPGQSFSLGVGTAAGLFSAVTSGAALTAVRALRNSDTDSMSVLFSFSLVGSLMSLPLAVFGWQAPSGAVLWGSLGVGLLSITAQFVMTHAFRYVSTAVGTSMTLLTPLFSWGLGILFLHERINPLAILGVTVCLAGVLISTGVWRRLPRLGTP